MNKSYLPNGRIVRVSVSTTGLVNIIFPTQTIFLDEWDSADFLEAVTVCQKNDKIDWVAALMRVANRAYEDPDAVD